MPELPPLDDLLGKKVQVDGYEWTVRRSPIDGRIALERPFPPEHEAILQALRAGAAALQTDPADLIAQALPSNVDNAALEWRYLDAMIAGAREHGGLTPGAIALLERRLGQLTDFLTAGE